MIIQHNIMALNAHRQLGGNNSLVAKNLEKLSSGFKINRAGDDAAGLAISEKMRAQITGLNRAQSNAQDGISLVQTAEGALTEVHSMLNRMVDLATQASNGTMQASDRTKIQDEIDALNGEIERISQATNFNGIDLLNGSLGAAGNTTANITWNGVSPTSTITPPTATKYAEGTAVVATVDGAKVTFTDASGASKTITVAFKAGADSKATAKNMADALNADADFSKVFKAINNTTDGKMSFEAKTAGASKAKITEVETLGTGTAKNVLGNVTPGADKITSYNLSGGLKVGDKVQVGGKTYTYTAGADGTDGKTFKNLATLAVATALNGITANVGTDTAVTFVSNGGNGLELQIGDTAAAFNKVSVKVDNMGSGGLNLIGLSVETQGDADNAIQSVKDAIEMVSKNRSAMGALQNRLEHTINNLGVTAENMTAAESRIRDVDMAKEMMAFTKNNVLTQAAQAMLAQANQQPQQVLQLLR